ncbi:MAG: hypothetical protein HN726_02055 [Candidatus Magasanikbacteria bacterium]|jgi:hypothetical protein|nr:hypothetical protein [Candidatus Magasanikbacteria bacterium]MBT4220888.1 hypothetical protein [Candidatus Magasanikbacteria bacterium]MBT4350349.1 hypothetical protein [Candidatus Magasanikbacteria bacterium]MBT6252791.1 hypothetical protein [Candidatus Magasanikbacteria bacterium]MBT6334535.1 hypothetical protein [Candidatus Magasanikbacteria bacterium]
MKQERTLSHRLMVLAGQKVVEKQEEIAFAIMKLACQVNDGLVSSQFVHGLVQSNGWTLP